jgi:hypothetical protein
LYKLTNFTSTTSKEARASGKKKAENMKPMPKQRKGRNNGASQSESQNKAEVRSKSCKANTKVA